jgi:uncharacterized repeat protein (TIGR03803 family)
MKKSLLTLASALACVAITLSLAVCAQAQTVTTLASFSGVNGSSPFGSVVQATDGNFYGTTNQAGASSTSLGTVFRVTPSGKLTDLYNFCSKLHCSDGSVPYTAPVLGNDGNLYGVTSAGGSDAGSESGSGTVYKMTVGGKITTLYTFCRATPCTDGQNPFGIIQASDGNFYGTTSAGGKFNAGTIFSIGSTGTIKSLYSFCARAKCADGSVPVHPPIQGSDGNFYGTTTQGGPSEGGVVYELTAAGGYKVLHSFCSDASCNDGVVPTTLVQDAKGNLFGTTQGGTGFDFFGTVFEITVANQYKSLHTFDYIGADPTGMTLGNDGNFYGTAQGNGTAGVGGIIFEITPAGVFTQLHTYGTCIGSGYFPLSPLFLSTDGLFYGTTHDGGNGTNFGCGGFGTIYSLSNGLSPLVETVPVAGGVGQTILILGNNLTGTSSVKFNGKSAAFHVVSDSEITATVPAGATTGTVSVVAPSGTLDSNPQFVVTK